MHVHNRSVSLALDIWKAALTAHRHTSVMKGTVVATAGREQPEQRMTQQRWPSKMLIGFSTSDGGTWPSTGPVGYLDMHLPLLLCLVDRVGQRYG